jgi:hypothetical protein
MKHCFEWADIDRLISIRHHPYRSTRFATSSKETMRTFFEIVLDWIFGCHHRHLSRVFTIDHHTYQVCFACGAKLRYSWRTMSLIKTDMPPTRGAFAAMFTQMTNNLWEQSPET